MKIIVDLDEVPCPYASAIYSSKSKETEVRCFANDKRPMGLLSISNDVRTIAHIPKCDRTNCPKKI